MASIRPLLILALCFLPRTVSAQIVMTSSVTTPGISVTVATTTTGDYGAIYIDNSRNANHALSIYTAFGGNQQLNGLLFIRVDTPTYNEPLIYLSNSADSSNGGAAELRLDAKNPDIELIETDQSSCGTSSSGACGKWEIAVNDDAFQINQRNSNNSSFERLFDIRRTTWSSGMLFIGLNAPFDAPQSTVDIKGNLTIGGSYAGHNSAPVNGAIIQGAVGIGLTAPASPYLLDVASAAHATSWITSSDRALKKNINRLTGVLEKLKNVHGVTFEWNETYASLGRSTSGRQIGLIAQEVEAEFPELVSVWSQKEKGSRGSHLAHEFRGLDYGRFAAVLLQAVQEQQDEIAMLRKRLDRLEAK